MSAEELLDAVRHLPDQVRDAAVAAADVEGLPDREGITEVVLLGVGGGRVSADVVEALAELRASVPVIATGARSPSWLDSSSLAIAISHSGDDEAPLASMHLAVEAGARRIRPALMTAATTLLALIPVLTSSGKGADIMVPMAIPSFGGMFVVVVRVLTVPVLYSWMAERGLVRRDAA